MSMDLIQNVVRILLIVFKKMSKNSSTILVLHFELGLIITTFLLINISNENTRVTK